MIHSFAGSRRFSTWATTLLVLFVLAFALAACGGDEEAAAGGEAVATGPVKFIYFSSSDCGPCEGMAPIIEGVEKDFAGKLTLERVDASTDEGKKQMEQYGLKAPPSYAIIAPNGTKLWALDGAIHKDMLRQQVTNFAK